MLLSSDFSPEIIVMRRICITFCLLFFANVLCISQEATLDDFLPKINKLSDSLIFLEGMNEIQKLAAAESDEALLYTNKFIRKAEQIEYHKGIGDGYAQRGLIYNDLNQRAKAMLNFELATEFYEKIKYHKGLAFLNINKSRIAYEKGRFSKAIDHLLEAKSYYEKNVDTIALSDAFNNLGNSYAGLGDFKNAKEYYEKSIVLKKYKRLSTTNIMNNLALLYIENKKADSAKTLLHASLKMGKRNEEMRSIAQSYSILAKVALFKNELEKSKKYYDSTQIVGAATNWQALLINAKQQMALIAMKEKKYQKADQLLTYARKEFLALDMTSLLLKNYKFSLKLDSLKGDYKNAMAWQRRYQELSDKRTAEVIAKKIEDAEESYEAELERRKFIDEKEKKERQTETELFRYRVLAFITLGVLLVILIFLIVIIKNRKERKRYIKELDNSNQIKNKLFSIISHDLKNEIHGLEGSLNLMKDDAIPVEEFKAIIPLLANRTHQTSIMLHNLLNWSKSQLQELSANPTSFDITEVISDKFTFFRPKASQKEIKLINKLNPTQIYADKDMFSIVAQNLIANAIKFCNPGDSISLVSNEKDSHYEICFSDTGIGIDPQHLDKLFAEDTYTTKGTQNESGTGLGLKICKELIELNNGKIEVKSTLGEGSTFCILLPKAA